MEPGLTGGLFFQRSQGQPLFPSLTYPVNNSSLSFFLAERRPVPKPRGDHARAARLGSFRTQRWGLCTLCQPGPWPEAARSCRPFRSRGRARLSPSKMGVKPQSAPLPHSPPRRGAGGGGTLERGKQPGLREDGWGMGDRSAWSGDAGLRFQQAESRGAGLLLGDQASLPSNHGITGHASALEYLEGTAWIPGTPDPGRPAAFPAFPAGSSARAVACARSWWPAARHHDLPRLPLASHPALWTLPLGPGPLRGGHLQGLPPGRPRESVQGF